ncbi:hypothetical protein [Pseudomonas putida]|uniref:hypothetical protein n=1 Tax=Pseudomonas putida TaxID=303 RepID=UPI004046FA8F
MTLILAKVNLFPGHAPLGSPNALTRLAIDTLKLHQSALGQIQTITAGPNPADCLRRLTDGFSTEFDSLKSIAMLRPALEHRHKTATMDCGSAA